MLILLRQTPFDDLRLHDAFTLARADDAIVLLEDAVMALLDLPSTHATVYALSADLKARGLTGRVNVESIDDRGLVRLTETAEVIQTWN